jgi:hypothetical protein
MGLSEGGEDLGPDSRVDLPVSATSEHRMVKLS